VADKYVLIQNRELEAFRRELTRPVSTQASPRSSAQDASREQGLQRVLAAMQRSADGAVTMSDLTSLLKSRADQVREGMREGVDAIRKIASDSVNDLVGANRDRTGTSSRGKFEGALSDIAEVIALAARRVRTSLSQMVAPSRAVSPPPKVMYAARGGSVFKPVGTDTVPAMLTPGEFVIPAEQAQRHAELLGAIRSGALDKTKYLSKGGSVGTSYLSQGGRVAFPQNEIMANATLAELRNAVADAIKEMVPTMAAQIGSGGGGGGGGDFERRNIDVRGEDAKQELQRSMESFSKSAKTTTGKMFGTLIDSLRDVGGLVSYLAGEKLIRMADDALDTSKAINNVTGASMASAEAVKAFQSDAMWANTATRRAYGFTTQQIRDAQLGIVEYGVAGSQTMVDLSDQALVASRALNMSSGETAQHYGKIRRDLRLGVRSIASLARGSVRVAQQTGTAAKNVADMERGLAEQITLYKQLGARDARGVESLARQQAVGTQFGTEDILATFRQSATGIDQFDASVNKLGVTVALARTELMNMRDASGRVKHTFMDLQSGRIVQTEGGRRDIMKATAAALDRLNVTTAGMPDDFANTFIAQYTNNEIRSRDQLVDAIRSAQVSGMSPSEQLLALRGITRQVGEMRSAGLSDADIGDRVKNLATGFGDITDEKTLKERMSTITGIARNEKAMNLAEAGDRMNQVIDRLMSSAGGGLSFRDAEAKAMGEVRSRFSVGADVTAKDLRDAISVRAGLDRAGLEKGADQATLNAKDAFAKASEQALAYGMSPIEMLMSQMYGVLTNIATYAGIISGAVVTIVGYMALFKGMGAIAGIGGKLKGAFGAMGGFTPGGLDDTLRGGGGSRKGPAGALGELSESAKKGGRGSIDAKGFLGELVKVAAVIVTVGGVMALMSKVMPGAAQVAEVTGSLLLSLAAFGVFWVALRGFQELSDRMGGLNWSKIWKPIMATLGGMVLIGAGLALVMKATALAWSLVSEDEIAMVKGKITQSLPVLGGLLLATVTAFAAGGIIGALLGKAAAAKAVLVGAAVAIPALLLGMAAIGVGLGLVMRAVSWAWGKVSPSEMQDVKNKVTSAAPVLGGLLLGTVALFAVGGVIGLNPALAAALAGAAVVLVAVLGGMAILGAGLGLTMAVVVKGWESVSVKEIEELKMKMSGSAYSLKAMLLAATLFTLAGPVALAGNVLDLFGAGPMATLDQMAEVGVKTSQVISRVSAGWDGVSVGQIEEITRKVTSAATGLEALHSSASLYTKSGPLAKLGGVMDWLGFGSNSTLDQMVAVSEQVANTIRDLAWVYKNNFPDVQALSGTIDGVNQLIARVVRGVVVLARHGERLDPKTMTEAMSTVGKLNSLSGELKTINTTSETGAGGVMTGSLQDGESKAILDRQASVATSETGRASDEAIYELIAVTKKVLGETSLIRAALSFKPTPSGPRTLGNDRGSFGKMYTERNGEMNPSPYTSWDQSVAGNPTESSTNGAS
jgi:hypothetical protein